MWQFHFEELSDRRGRRYELLRDNEPVSFDRVLGLLMDDASFRLTLMLRLCEAPYTAFRWETPPVTVATIDSPWEFVLLDSPSLDRKPDREAFADHYKDGANGVVEFTNLGGDARLIVPCPQTEDSAYGHLAAFLRFAPAEQTHVLWQTVAATMNQQIGKRPIWLNTAGAGVSWLHIRLDSRPKYYGYEPYTA